jgi:hypothetical protein
MSTTNMGLQIVDFTPTKVGIISGWWFIEHFFHILGK